MQLKNSYARWKNHRLRLSQAFDYKPHFVVEPLHPILTPPDILRILVLHNFSMAVLAHKYSSKEVHQLIDFQWRVCLVALRADVAFVVKFLYMFQCDSD